MTQPDENEAQAAPEEPPSPTFSRSNNGASADDGGDGGPLIFGWINGDPGLISAQPCSDLIYTLALEGAHSNVPIHQMQ